MIVPQICLATRWQQNAGCVCVLGLDKFSKLNKVFVGYFDTANPFLACEDELNFGMSYRMYQLSLHHCRVWCLQCFDRSNQWIICLLMNSYQILFDLLYHRCTLLYRIPISRKIHVPAIFREPQSDFLVFYDPFSRNSCRNLINWPFIGNRPFR